jgi:hypothetical protein
MKIFKKILLSLLIAASMGAISTSALAEGDAGRISYTPTDAIDLVGSKIKIALDAASTGADGAKVADLTKEALDASKEINANDKVDMARQRANNVLKTAKANAKDGKVKEAEEALRDAAAKFEALKSLL